MASTVKRKKFYAAATKGYTLKVTFDSLTMSMPRTTFRVTPEGFFHRKPDEREHILWDVAFPRENFASYVCKEELVFSLNLKHLQKMVRNIKKKDSVVLFIEKKNPDKLYIAIRPSITHSEHESRVETAFVNITYLEDTEPPMDLPEIYVEDDEEINVYNHPKVVDSTVFQKMKKMTTVGKIVTIEMQKGNYISFCGDNGDLYGSKLECGEIIESTDGEEEEDEESDDDEIEGWYEAEFHMRTFSALMKLPGLCTQMQFYAPKIERYPLKVRVQAGTMGPITVYIKDRKQVAIEQTRRDQHQAEKTKKRKR
jgi:hypothetical protein